MPCCVSEQVWCSGLTFSLSLLCTGQHLNSLYLCQLALLWSRLPARLCEPTDHEKSTPPPPLPPFRLYRDNACQCYLSGSTCLDCWVDVEMVVPTASFRNNVKWSEGGAFHVGPEQFRCNNMLIPVGTAVQWVLATLESFDVDDSCCTTQIFIQSNVF